MLPEPQEGRDPCTGPLLRFTCYLDDHPDHLVLQRYVDQCAGADECPLTLNPNIRLTRGDQRAEGALHPLLLSQFDSKDEIAWVQSPVTGLQEPFWLRETYLRVLSGLLEGSIEPKALALSQKTVLKLAGILVQPTLSTTRWDRTVIQLGDLFLKRGYCPVTNLINSLHLAALRRHYRQLIRLGTLKLGDAQTCRRYVAHNESAAQIFHHHLTPIVTSVVRQPVKPSYVYTGAYQSGAELEKHTDREQCEFSLTLALDYSPEPVRETPWPLQLHTKESVVNIFQGLGDGLIYRGREIPHSRHILPDGHTSTSIFFHYVPADFQGSLD